MIFKKLCSLPSMKPKPPCLDGSAGNIPQLLTASWYFEAFESETQKFDASVAYLLQRLKTSSLSILKIVRSDIKLQIGYSWTIFNHRGICEQ